MPDPNPSPETAPLPLPPDPDNMNDKRAAAAERALLSFAADFGELIEGADLTQQNLADLLADLAHLCDRKGLDLGERLGQASRYYADETDNEGRQFGIFGDLCPTRGWQALPAEAASVGSPALEEPA